MKRAILLHAPLSAVPRAPVWMDALLQALPYPRHVQLSRSRAAERQASLAGIALVLFGAERLTGRSHAPRELSFPPEQKPCFVAGPEFSLSHAATRVACIVTTTDACGLDIEDAPADGLDAAALDRLQRWTATEAVLKAAGLGLRSARDVTLDGDGARGAVGGREFALQPLRGIEGVVGHVAAAATLDWTEERVQLDGDALAAALERSLGLPAQVD